MRRGIRRHIWRVISTIDMWIVIARANWEYYNTPKLRWNAYLAITGAAFWVIVIAVGIHVLGQEFAR